MSKRIKIPNELVFINILTLMLILIIALLPPNVLRIIMGLPLVLFFPGRVLVMALFPRRVDTGSIERVALGFGLSIVVTVLVGLVLNYTPWGISLYPILISLALFTLATSAIAYYRWHRLPGDKRFTLSLQVALPQWAGLSNLDKALSIVLMLSILGATGVLFYVVAAPRAGEQFTEFYILGPEGEAKDYPKKLVVGEEAIVTLGIVNHEGQEMSYHIEVVIDGVKNGELGPLLLADNEEKEEEVGLVPQKAGDNQRVEFLLYKDGEGKPYATLHLFIDARE